MAEDAAGFGVALRVLSVVGAGAPQSSRPFREPRLSVRAQNGAIYQAMKTLPPLMILCYGALNAWTARVLKVGTAGGKWRRPDEGDGREATAGTARDAVLKAITIYGKEPRVCRRCARTWECKRGRAIKVCPQCQTRKAEP